MCVAKILQKSGKRREPVEGVTDSNSKRQRYEEQNVSQTVETLSHDDGLTLPQPEYEQRLNGVDTIQLSDGGSKGNNTLDELAFVASMLPDHAEPLVNDIFNGIENLSHSHDTGAENNVTSTDLRANSRQTTSSQFSMVTSTESSQRNVDLIEDPTLQLQQGKSTTLSIKH